MFLDLLEIEILMGRVKNFSYTISKEFVNFCKNENKIYLIQMLAVNLDPYLISPDFLI